jgi:hypothetical protein
MWKVCSDFVGSGSYAMRGTIGGAATPRKPDKCSACQASFIVLKAHLRIYATGAVGASMDLGVYA